MGKPSRAKGGRGACEARKVLTSHGYYVEALTAGLASHDLTAELDGTTYAVEVKNCAAITLAAHESQAREQGTKSGYPWLLMERLAGYPRTVLVTGSDCDPHILRLREAS